MAILRSLVQESAIQFNNAVDFMISAVVDAIEDDFCFPAKAMPESIPKFVPCREGRSLYSIVKRRSLSKKSAAGRLAGINHGKNVTFFDD